MLGGVGGGFGGEGVVGGVGDGVVGSDVHDVGVGDDGVGVVEDKRWRVSVTASMTSATASSEMVSATGSAMMCSGVRGQGV